jgi:hypothetical protein
MCRWTEVDRNDMQMGNVGIASQSSVKIKCVF